MNIRRLLLVQLRALIQTIDIWWHMSSGHVTAIVEYSPIFQDELHKRKE